MDWLCFVGLFPRWLLLPVHSVTFCAHAENIPLSPVHALKSTKAWFLLGAAVGSETN